MSGAGVTVGLGWLLGWVLDVACWRVWSWRQCHCKNMPRCAVMLRFRAWCQMWQIVDNGLEGQLARGWGVQRLQEVGKLDVDFFKFPDCMAQLVETIEAVGR